MVHLENCDYRTSQVESILRRHAVWGRGVGAILQHHSYHSQHTPRRKAFRCGSGPSRRQTVKWVAVRHSGAWLKIERKSQRILQPFHYVVGKPADLAFEAHSWQRSQSLNIGYRFTIKERKPRQRHFVRAVPALGGKRHVQDESGGSGSWRETMTTGASWQRVPGPPARSHRVGGSSSRSRTSCSAARERAISRMS